jgi:putative membrane protein
VRVETGGGKAPEATISVLHETVFEEMRRRVFAGRAQVASEERKATQDSHESDAEPSARREDARREDAQREDGQTLLYLPVRELLLNGLLENRGLVLVGTAYGLLWEAGLFRGFWDRLASGSYGPGIVRDTFTTLAAGNLPSPGRIGILFVGLVGLLLVVRAISMAWSFLRLHEFRLTRVGEDLRTEYGLLTRVTTTIPLKRVQSLTVSESPLHRLVERMSVRVETAGGQGSPENGQPKQPREQLAPIIRRSAMPALVREVLPGFELDRLDWQALHPRAFRRAMKPALVLSVVTAVPFVFWFGWIGLGVLPLTVPLLMWLAWVHVRYTRWAATEDALVLRSGRLWYQLTIVPVAKIQVVGCVESPFDRRAAMTDVRVDTAGSPSHSHRITIPYLARETASALYERLADQTAQTAFRW